MRSENIKKCCMPEEMESFVFYVLQRGLIFPAKSGGLIKTTNCITATLVNVFLTTPSS